MRAVCLLIWMVETMAGKWKQIAKNLVGMHIRNSSTQNTYLTKRRGRNGAGVIHQLKRITIRPLPEDRNTWGPKPRPAFSVSKRAFYPTSSSGPGKPYITTRSQAVNVARTLLDGDEWNTLSTFNPSSFYESGLSFQRLYMKHQWYFLHDDPIIPFSLTTKSNQITHPFTIIYNAVVYDTKAKRLYELVSKGNNLTTTRKPFRQERSLVRL